MSHIESAEHELFLREMVDAGIDTDTMKGRLLSRHYCEDCKQAFKDGKIGWADIRENHSSFGCERHTRHAYRDLLTD